YTSRLPSRTSNHVNAARCPDNARSGYLDARPSSPVSRTRVLSEPSRRTRYSSSSAVSTAASNTTYAPPSASSAAFKFQVVGPTGPSTTGAPPARPSTSHHDASTCSPPSASCSIHAQKRRSASTATTGLRLARSGGDRSVRHLNPRSGSQTPSFALSAPAASLSYHA